MPKFLTLKLHKRLFSLVIIFFVMLTASTTNFAVAKPIVTFCAETRPYPPFVYMDDKEQLTGTLVDIIKRSAHKAGISPVFIAHPWLRCQKLVEDNEAQALFGMIQTPERELLYQFPAEQDHYIARAEYPVFYAKNSVIQRYSNSLLFSERFNMEAYRDVRHYGLQAPLGYVVQKLLSSKGLTAENNYTVDEGLEMAARNRLDGYVVERNIGLSRIKSLNLTNELVVSSNTVTTDYWYVPFNKQFYSQNESLVKTFWHHIGSNRE